MKKSIGANTIIHPCPVLIVGTYDGKNVPNIMNAAWGGICCSKPPCIAVSLRKATYTYANIFLNRAFTVSIPSTRHIKEADYAGIYSGKEGNKFEELGLTAAKGEFVNAPYVEEFPYALECRLLHTIEIGLHTLFVGEILDVKADEKVLGENNLPDIEKVKPLIYATGNQQYYELGKALGRAFVSGKKK